MEKEVKKQDSKYNLNETDFLLIGDLQREAFIYRNKKRNYAEALERWKSVRMLIDSRFDTDENKELDKIETEFYKKIDAEELKKQNIDIKKFYVVVEYRKRKILDKYIKKLRNLMRDYKIAMTDLERKTKLD